MVGAGRVRGDFLASLAVLMTVLGLAVGLPAMDRALPAARPVAAEASYLVGGGVSLVPPPGARVDVTRTRRGADRGAVLFLLGPVRYAVVVTPFGGDLAGAVEKLRRKLAATRGYRVDGTEHDVRTRTGLLGRQGRYTAAGRTGWYAVFLVGGAAIEVTVSGTDPELRRVLGAVQASIRSLDHRGAV